MKPSRREILRAAAWLTAAGWAPRTGSAQSDGDGWNAGDVVHLVPAANHDRFHIKCSFASPRERAPALRCGSAIAEGVQTDSGGRFFSFDVSGLSADTEYELKLLASSRSSQALCDPWPLRTFPWPDDRPFRARLLVYTCAGGHPEMGTPERRSFQPLEVRRRLLQRGLSFRPNAALAIGDHIYWDQRTWLESSNAAVREGIAAFYAQVGELDRSKGALGTSNEAVIQRAVGPQIAELYGTLLRSVPSYFVNDDHDYFENDEATDRFVTLPPARYQLDFARFVRQLYLPEFLPDPARPVSLSGTGAGDRAAGLSESFGTFRWGRLAEVLIYDCGRYLSLKGKVAGLVPDEVERWLQARTRDEQVSQLVHVPSHPFGWTAGKWREWYPDVAASEDGGTSVSAMLVAEDTRHRLTTDQPKFHWQEGWWLQHQRLLEALGSQKRRPGVVLSGDLHAIGHSKLVRSADLDLATNPVHAIIAGSPGCKSGWPSRVRGTPPLEATGVVHEPEAPIAEKNGFSIIDLTQDEVTVKLFAWSDDQPVEAIDELEPFHTALIRRS